jgi:hypothetical protein
MPRYRFKWESVPEDLLVSLALAADCEGLDPPRELRRRFGARPKEDFVRDTWPTLRDEWLASDRQTLRRVVEALRSAGIGKSDEPDPVEYLRSIRNSKTMRGIVLSEFHDLGDVSLNADPTPSSEPAAKVSPGSLPKIGRPGRKHVQFNSIEESPEGQHFITQLVSLVGPPDIVPLGKVRNTHVFAAFGPKGRALIAEKPDQQPESDRWRSLTAFRTDMADPVEVSIEMIRWDPWLAFDDDEVRNATRKQRQEWDDRRVELATDSDTLTITHRPSSAQNEPLLDLTTDEVQACWQLLKERTPEPPIVEEETAEQVGSRVLELLRQTTGNEQLVPDKDGDIPIQFGSSMVFVKVFGDPPVVRVYSPVLERVTSAAVAAAAVNDLNQHSAFTKWLVLNDSIIAVVDLFGRPLSESHVLGACSVVGNSADSLDEELQARLGGKTFFGEVKRPGLPEPTAGYL